jgi:hypothetical protein
MKLFIAALVSTLALPSLAIGAAPMSGSSEWVLFFDGTGTSDSLGRAMKAKQIIEKAGGEIRCAYGKHPSISSSVV